jgi:hypothetical protein
MIGENLASFFLLYVKPVAAISRLLDHGRLWMAIGLAALVTVLIHIPPQVQPADPVADAVAKVTRKKMPRSAMASPSKAPKRNPSKTFTMPSRAAAKLPTS